MLNKEQRVATYPHHSVWLSASAGTGKTKVLTDRTLRLLLDDVAPEKILCITFTKAAASEMLLRIMQELYSWSILDGKALQQSLNDLLGRPPSQLHLAKAQKLYLDINHHNTQINIQTIHSFCQSILSRFPVEVGVMPGSRVIDELERRDIITKIIQNMSVISPSDATLYLVAHLHQVTFDDVVNSVIAKAMQFQYFFDSNTGWYESVLRKLLHLSIENTNTNLVTKALSAVERILNDCRGHDELPAALHNLEYTQEYYVENLKPIFFTKSGSMRAKLLPKAIAKAHPKLHEALLQIQEIFTSLEDKLKASQILEYTGYLLQFAQEFLQRYAEYKQLHSLLDYDDLIYKTASFLQQGSHKQWVLYKLDGGIEHILVDEAQDTSHYQWQIIESLIAEFYAGSNTERPGSLFVVGDAKQSIYSFQGADIDIYYNVKKSIGAKIRLGGGEFQYIDLLTSYRSSQAILDLVYAVFLPIQTIQYTNLNCQRSSAEGKVELWNLSSDKFDNKTEKSFWQYQQPGNLSERRMEVLASHIARYIQQQVEQQKILPKTGKAAGYGDFMILIRKRGKFSHILAQTLINHGVLVAGLDRIELQNSQIIASIVCLSKFLLHPFDDTNLVELLMGPLFHFTQEEIHNLVLGKPKETTLWDYIQLHNMWVVDELSLSQRIYQSVSLREFYNTVLKIYDYETRLLDSITDEGSEVIEFFFNILNQYIDTHSSGMYGFILWLENSSLEIKRDLSKVDKVKILTVHGSKGLESPVVFIPETNDVPRGSRHFILQEKLFIAAKNKSFHNSFYRQLLEEVKEKQYQEYLRLLYVALTRAQDHLIICGDNKERTQEYASWYSLVAPHIANVHDLEVDITEVVQAQEIVGAVRPLYPKINMSDQDLHLSLSANYKQDMSYAVSYGQIAHKLLGDIILTKGDIDIVSHPLLQILSSSQKKKALQSCHNFMESGILRDILQGDAAIEVPLGVKAEGTLLEGRIDLLLETDSEVMIIDYKTDHTPARTIDDVVDSYKEQLLFYHQTMVNMMRDKADMRTVRSSILWLENMQLMQLFESSV